MISRPNTTPYTCVLTLIWNSTHFDALVICWRTISQWLFLTHYDAMIIYIDPIWRISDTWHITAPLMIYWRNVTPSSVCRSVRGTISTTSLHYAILSGKSSVFIANEGERKWRYEWYVRFYINVFVHCVSLSLYCFFMFKNVFSGFRYEWDFLTLFWCHN